MQRQQITAIFIFIRTSGLWMSNGCMDEYELLQLQMEIIFFALLC